MGVNMKKSDRSFYIFRLLLIVCTVVLFSACDSREFSNIEEVDTNEVLSDVAVKKELDGQKYEERDVLYFGFDLRSSPQEDIKQYRPFLDYLQEETGYRFKLHFNAKGDATYKDLATDHVQFAAIGAMGFLLAKSHANLTPIVRGLNNDKKAVYQSVFVTSPKSNIKKVEDIKGTKMAFGSKSSTQGHLIPRIILEKHGIQLKDLELYSYTGSHQKCAEAVISKKADVCGMQDQLAKKLVKEGLVKIVHSSAYYPSSGIVVNEFVPKNIVNKVTQALLNFEPEGKDGSNLYHWERTEMAKGFVEADEKDYQELKKWATKLGFLHVHRK